jgi:hypothetical protein
VATSRKQATNEHHGERKHENRNHAFARTYGGALGRRLDSASLGSRTRRSYSKVHRAGSTAISARYQKGEHGKQDIFVQSLHACRWLPPVASFQRPPAAKNRWTEARLISKALAISLSLMPCAFGSGTLEASMEAGRLRCAFVEKLYAKQNGRRPMAARKTGT